MAQTLPAGQAQGMAGLPLALVNRFDARAHNLSHIGGFKHGQGDQGGKKGAKICWRGKEQGAYPGEQGMAFRVDAAHTGQGDKLIRQKKIEQKNDDQGRQVTHQLNKAASQQAQVEALADSGQGHGKTGNQGEQAGPEAEPHRGQKSIYEVIGGPAAGFLVITKQELGHGSPVPVVVQLNCGAVTEEGCYSGQKQEQQAIKPAEGWAFQVHAGGRCRRSCGQLWLVLFQFQIRADTDSSLMESWNYCTRACHSTPSNQYS